MDWHHVMILPSVCWQYGEGNTYGVTWVVQQWLDQHAMPYKLSLISSLNQSHTWFSPMQVEIGFNQVDHLLLFKLAWGSA